MAAIVPRVKGKVVQKSSGGFHYEIYIFIGSEEPIIMAFDNEDYISFDAALIGLRKRATHVLDMIAKEMNASPIELIDMLSNQVVSKEEFTSVNYEKGKKNAPRSRK